MTFPERYLETLGAYWRTHRGAAPDNPSCMYLGKEEHDLFEAHIHSLGTIDVSPFDDQPYVESLRIVRATYRGAQVFRVDAQSHLAFSP